MSRASSVAQVAAPPAGGGTWACGTEATRALRFATTGHDVSCRPMTLDRYGRTVARCFEVHLDLRIIAAPGHVVNPLPVTVDVPFDRAALRCGLVILGPS